MDLDNTEGKSNNNESKHENTELLIGNAWLPPAILILALSVFLIYLLIPGTLIFPQKSIVNSPFGENQSDVEAGIEESLRLRMGELETALNTGTCSAGVFEIPSDVISLLPPANKGEGSSTDGKRALITPPANQLNAEFLDGNLSLEDLIRQSTVLVVSGEGEDAGFGTGFFINKNYIVTNAHVVEGDATNLHIYMDGQIEPIDASIKGKTLAFEISGRDYAVLLSAQPSDYFLSLHKKQSSLQLQSVVAAGFPGDALELLADFLHSADDTEEPEQLPLFITTGIVNAEQKFGNTENAIVHSATISQGNSGGPLTNTCGEVLGVNTFISTTEIRTLNIALSVEGLKQFLTETGIEFNEVSELCNPSLVQSERLPNQ